MMISSSGPPAPKPVISPPQDHQHHHHYYQATMSGNSRSREFPGIPASNSRPESREWNLPLAFPFPKMGMEFSICIPVPVNGNEIFLGFPGNFPGIPGNFPFPKVGNGIFYLFAFPFPKMGMEFAISHSRPEVQKSFEIMAGILSVKGGGYPPNPLTFLRNHHPSF